MKLSLSENISRLRKEKGMTQEQLAESLGVTFASVSKWERGVSTPELNLIAEMADLFGISLDALVGFEMKNGDVTAVENRIFTLQQDKKYDEAVTEAEKALVRFPNDFSIVYRSGELYFVAGAERGNPDFIKRSIELLERSVVTLYQNTDPEISEVSIRDKIAQCYILLGNPQKALEILKKYNAGGMHNTLIASIYVGYDSFSPKEAEPYLMYAFRDLINSSVQTMSVYARYYFRAENYASSIDTIIWLIDVLESLKIDKKAISFADKIAALGFCQCADMYWLLGEKDKAEFYLRRSYETAKAFDNAPTYKLDNMKFCMGKEAEETTLFDVLGESAMGIVENWLTVEHPNEDVYKMWKYIIEENN